MALSPDRTQLLVGSQAGLELLTWPKLLPIGKIPTELKAIHDIQFHPKGIQVLIAGGTPSEYGEIEVVGWPNHEQIRRLRLHRDTVYRVAWHADGQHWFTASSDGQCKVVSYEQGETIATYAGHSKGVLSVMSIPESDSCLSVGIDQTIRIWNSRDASHYRALDNHLASVNGSVVVNVHGDGRSYQSSASAAENVRSSIRVITWSEDRTLRLWDPFQGRMIRYTRLRSVPRALAWCQDRNLVVVACNDGFLYLLHADDFHEIGLKAGNVGRIHELLIDDSRKLIGIGGEKGVRVIELGEVDQNAVK